MCVRVQTQIPDGSWTMNATVSHIMGGAFLMSLIGFVVLYNDSIPISHSPYVRMTLLDPFVSIWISARGNPQSKSSNRIQQCIKNVFSTGK